MAVTTETMVRALLAEEPNLAADEIAVGVVKDRVVLRGKVRTQRERAAAEAAVRRIRGVRAVENHLVVTGEPI
ncbi:MAG: BON domain-containing protein [Armatimonadetes bacterium]|nr:BON domain-containing protein [Armatimonadota bacterium]